VRRPPPRQIRSTSEVQIRSQDPDTRSGSGLSIRSTSSI